MEQTEPMREPDSINMIQLRLTERVKQLEDIIGKLGPIEILLKRIKYIEDHLFMTKEILSLNEASDFLNASKSQLYKLTRTLAIPHYKPGGKAIYFYRSELLEWVKQNPAKVTVNKGDMKDINVG
ncbi:AlpA family transcriptional regulator [Bacteroides sp. 224]|uniref:helix-turn-helix transcriptional regulator n=1 Tax=Bacteroides sp. 224 TaxID=2302936 RepID=UPI001EF326CB|nr:helix-turn-helix domain-containing protein [Bacteroides sp. 224]